MIGLESLRICKNRSGRSFLNEFLCASIIRFSDRDAFVRNARNLGNWDKRQIQNETKTIYCISLIIFCEESRGQRRTTNKLRAPTTTNISAAALWILPAVSLSLPNLLLGSRHRPFSGNSSPDVDFCPHAGHFKLMNNDHPHNFGVRKFQLTTRVRLWLMTFCEVANSVWWKEP